MLDLPLSSPDQNRTRSKSVIVLRYVRSCISVTTAMYRVPPLSHHLDVGHPIRLTVKAASDGKLFSAIASFSMLLSDCSAFVQEANSAIDLY